MGFMDFSRFFVRELILNRNAVTTHDAAHAIHARTASVGDIAEHGTVIIAQTVLYYFHRLDNYQSLVGRDKLGLFTSGVKSRFQSLTVISPHVGVIDFRDIETRYSLAIDPSRNIVKLVHVGNDRRQPLGHKKLTR